MDPLSRWRDISPPQGSVFPLRASLWQRGQVLRSQAKDIKQLAYNQQTSRLCQNPCAALQIGGGEKSEKRLCQRHTARFCPGDLRFGVTRGEQPLVRCGERGVQRVRGGVETPLSPSGPAERPAYSVTPRSIRKNNASPSTFAKASPSRKTPPAGGDSPQATERVSFSENPLQHTAKAPEENPQGLRFKSASTYFHKPSPANYLRHKRA